MAGRGLTVIGPGLTSGIGGGLPGCSAEKATGVSPCEEIMGIASKAYNEIQRYALTHEQDDQPRTHQELGDNR
ncbi:hypothetical protein EKH77_30445 [Streptomyces luteoverticillatus]|uniref:Uncharacterized protein n=1 Tax=Streptomyces luteoverticillatus TaxID=66425 RepID=A0A3Q9FYQ3_STRLT|nr:hypothetical protein [Streptomyces luteoverticillatus]AZQ74934.1 hypothetical protein EKH77_30445 [Streptomyces luteoverticillatus]